MKKLLFLLGCLTLFWSSVSAGCQQLELDNATLCISIDKEANNKFQLNTDVINSNGLIISQTCSIYATRVPDHPTWIGNCNAMEFVHEGGGKEAITLDVDVTARESGVGTYAKRDKVIAIYDFDNGEWVGGFDSYDSILNKNAISDFQDFDIKISPTTPKPDEWADVTVGAIDSEGVILKDYYGTVDILIEYKDGSTWETLPDSSFDIGRISLNTKNISTSSNGIYYDSHKYFFGNSDNGKINFEIKFEDKGEYRIRVMDSTSKNKAIDSNREFAIEDNILVSNNNSSGLSSISNSGVSPYPYISQDLLAQIESQQSSLSNLTVSMELNDAISWLFTHGLTKYDSINTFRSSESITREQASKFFAMFNSLINDTTKIKNQDCKFQDIKNADPTLVTHISQACGQGTIKGSNGKFNPFGKLTKAQAIAILVRIMQGSLDESGDLWYRNYFDYAKSISLLDGMGYDINKADGEYITRGDMAILIYRSYNILNND